MKAQVGSRGTGLLFLPFICLRATTLSYDVAHRTVRSWRQNSFDCFCVDLGTRYVTICVVSRLLQEGVGESAIRWGVWSADCGGGVGKPWTEKESFQQYFYNRYKILHTCHTYCCYAYHFYAHWFYFIYVWHVYVSPKTYKWFGTLIIKDGRYTFTFLTSVLHGDNRSTPRPVRFTPGKKPSTSCTGGRVGTRAGLVGKKNLASNGIRSPDRTARFFKARQSLVDLGLPNYWGFKIKLR
jgi:hypothetical protein